MDFLLNPNVAYLILLGGILLGLMAVIVPGTGYFEIGALFCLALAGYAVYNLSFNWWALVILVLSIFPFLYSIQKPKREIYLGLSILLLVIGSVFLFATDGWKPAVNPFVALVTRCFCLSFYGSSCEKLCKPQKRPQCTILKR